MLIVWPCVPQVEALAGAALRLQLGAPDEIVRMLLVASRAVEATAPLVSCLRLLLRLLRGACVLARKSPLVVGTWDRAAASLVFAPGHLKQYRQVANYGIRDVLPALRSQGTVAPCLSLEYAIHNFPWSYQVLPSHRSFFFAFPDLYNYHYPLINTGATWQPCNGAGVLHSGSQPAFVHEANRQRPI